MKKHLGMIALLCAMILSAEKALASTPNFTNVTSSQFTSIMNDFSAYSSYTSVSGASGRGSVFGFEVGLIAGLTSTPNVNSVAQQTDPSASVSMIPNASILAAISIPMGLSFELVFLPSNTFDGVSYQQYGGAVQYKLLSLPFNLAAKAHYTKTDFNFGENLSGVNTTVSVDNKLFGADLIASMGLLVIEPYLGVGYETASASMGVTGTNSIFSSAFTTSESASASPSSARVFIGADINLLLLTIGAEYLHAYGTSRYNLKLSAGF